MPRRSTRLVVKRSVPVQAASVARKRARLPRPQATVSTASPQTTVSTVSPQATATELSAPAMEMLISTVVEEVTKRLNQAVPAVPAVPSTTACTDSAPAQPVMEIPLASAVSETIALAPSAVDSLVQSSLISAQPSLQGEPLFPAIPFLSSALAVDARVTDKIRQKIWNNEYFDFGSLLVNPVSNNGYKVTVKNAEPGSSPSLCLEPAEKPRKITSIDSWLTAFHVFVGIFCMKYPSDAPALMKYGSLIRDLAARGHNWRSYDENFRFLRQNQVSSLPWGSIHSELWLHAQSSPVNKQPIRGSTSRAPQTDLYVPVGFCIKFHKGLDCTGCNYKHACFKCDGEHRANSCTFRASGRNAARRPFPAKSDKAPTTNTSKRR